MRKRLQSILSTLVENEKNDLLDDESIDPDYLEELEELEEILNESNDIEILKSEPEIKIDSL